MHFCASKNQEPPISDSNKEVRGQRVSKIVPFQQEIDITDHKQRIVIFPFAMVAKIVTKLNTMVATATTNAPMVVTTTCDGERHHDGAPNREGLTALAANAQRPV